LSAATHAVLSRHQEAGQDLRQLRALLPGTGAGGLPALAIKDEVLDRLKRALEKASLVERV
jgi:hypothetical protein